MSKKQTRSSEKNEQKTGSNSQRSARLDVAKTYKLYIDGKFPRSESGRYIKQQHGEQVVANICRSSRKDFREAVVAARGAQSAWSRSSAYLKGQIVYRMAEMLEGRREQYCAELTRVGITSAKATKEVEESIDCLVHYAGWADKYQQLFSSINPVASSHFNFSVLEPTGVVALVAPGEPALLGLVANLIPIIVGGNTAVVLASDVNPAIAISFAEVLHASDLPGGVVNVLTGEEAELVSHFALHMDVNALIYCDDTASCLADIQTAAANNLKRVVARRSLVTTDPYLIRDTQEVKTTWHPIGS